jgi:ABC-type sugar transport system ATPase subunit
MTAPRGAANPSAAPAGAAAHLEGISKSFPGVKALDDVTLDVRRGEVHALLGENGAGKSTLVKILAGLIRPDSGSIHLDEAEVVFHGPRDAQRRGISYVPQEVQAVPDFSVGRNMLLGFEGPFDRKGKLSAKDRRLTREALDLCGASFSESAMAGRLSVPELRLAQISRTLLHPGDVILLDEPNAALSENDATAMLERLRLLRDQQKAIIYVSHRLTEVLGIADRITVLRDGHAVGTFPRAELDKDKIVSLMTKDSTLGDHEPAGPVALRSASPAATNGNALLEVDGLTSAPNLLDVTLSLRPGQIVGVAGVQGSGHGHLLRAIAGIDGYEQGRIAVRGQALHPALVRHAYRAGVVLVPADRRASAIVPEMSVRANLTLPIHSTARRAGMRRIRQERQLAREYVNAFGIRPANTEVLAGNLSGGNQQKLALARALVSKPGVLLLDEPTQGIDVAAKGEILTLIRRLVQDMGFGVVVASSEFEELLAVADLIHVMSQGRMVATFPAEEADYERILHAALP